MSATTAADPVETLLARLDGAKVRGDGSWQARCPAHDDKSPSLNVRRGDDGRALVRCYAGCEVEAVVAAVGLTMGDLFPLSRPERSGPRIILNRYPYRDEAGALLYEVVRYLPKGFGQRRPNGTGGWEYSLNGARRVPYRLPELLAASRGQWVVVVEGEKDADALAAIGIVATTNAQGAGKWPADFATFFAGRRVAILPDNDDPGRDHAGRVARSLHGTAVDVRVVALPDLPAKGDVSDWLGAGGTADELRRLVEAAPAWVPAGERSNSSKNSNSSNCSNPSNAGTMGPTTAAMPFPVDALPEPIRAFVVAAAGSIGCPPDFVAATVLALAEGVAGKSRRLVVKPGFCVSPGGWYGIVAEPGAGKSPAMRHALRLVEPLQAEAWERYRQRLDEWEETPKDERGDRPSPEHFFVGDSTMEALATALASSAGVVQYEDELRRRLKSLDSYRQGGDRQSMLALWSNAPIKIVRKTSTPIYVPFPSAPLVGGIQPGVLGRLKGEGDDAAADDGWVPRFLLCWPEAEPLEWTDEGIDESTIAPALDVFRALRLYGPEPHDTTLSPNAYAAFKEWHADNRRAQMAATGLERQWAAKAPIHLARVALVLHLLAFPKDRRPVALATMHDAIEVVEYYRAHLSRVLPAFGGSGGAGPTALAARVLRALAKAGGWTSTSDLLRALGNVPADALRPVLDALLADGRVERREETTATKPKTLWRGASGPENDVRTFEEFEQFEQSRAGGGAAAPCPFASACVRLGPCDRRRAGRPCEGEEPGSGRHDRAGEVS